MILILLLMSAISTLLSIDWKSPLIFRPPRDWSCGDALIPPTAECMCGNISITFEMVSAHRHIRLLTLKVFFGA